MSHDKIEQLDSLMVEVIQTLILEGLIIHGHRVQKRGLVDREGTAEQVANRVVAAINLDMTVRNIRKKKEQEIMPNSVSYSDEKTKTKVLRALAGKGDLDFEQTLAAVERLEEAGILFREEAETAPRGPRKKNADGSELVELPQPAQPTETSVPNPTGPEPTQ